MLGNASPALKQYFYSLGSNFLSNQVAIERFQGKLREDYGYLAFLNPRVFQMENLSLTITP